MATDFSLLKEIGMLQSDYNRLLKSKAFTKKALCELVIPFRDKHGLSDSEALQIARNEMSISQMAEILEAKDPNPVAMHADEKAADAFSRWCHDKHDRFLQKYEDTAANKALYYKGLAEAFHNAGCMFDALTTRNSHLPPEMVKYLREESVVSPAAYVAVFMNEEPACYGEETAICLAVDRAVLKKMTVNGVNAFLTGAGVCRGDVHVYKVGEISAEEADRDFHGKGGKCGSFFFPMRDQWTIVDLEHLPEGGLIYGQP